MNDEFKKPLMVGGIIMLAMLLLYVMISWFNHIAYCSWGVPKTGAEGHYKSQVCK